ncbi:hypothetical protein [Stieleria marina]
MPSNQMGTARPFFRNLFGLLVVGLATFAASSATSQEAKEVATEQNEVDSGADADDAAELKADVLEWVDQLDAPSLSKRKLAEKRLIEAGADALKYLPEKKAGVSIEAIERLVRVRKALMMSKTQTQSSAITIRLNDVADLGEALEAISRDSGVEFEHQADESQKIDPVATPLSFWHALDLVLDQANLDVNFYGGDRGVLALQPREEGRTSRVDSAAYTGVYRIEPMSVNSRRVLNQPSQSGMNVAMEIAWEPRMTPIGLTIPISQLSGKLDDGNSIKPQESGEKIDIATNADLAFSEFYLPLELPVGRPGKIKSLSGTIEALLPGKTQTFELPLKEPNPKKTIDALTVEVEEIRKNGTLHEVRVGLKLVDPDRSLESHRHWIFENPLYVRLKDGSRAEHLGYETYRQSKDGVGIGYLFELGDSYSEATLVYESPTAVVNNEVNFVIQDIKLP